MKKYSNKSWYSVILAILIVWFMLTLTTWVFSLVLRESKDTKSMEYYLKALEWANWAAELAMLKAKNFNYSMNYSISNTINNESAILSVNPTNILDFKKSRDVLISYDMDSIANDINKDLDSWMFDIIPLFYYNSANNKIVNIKNITLNSNNAELVWNIVWSNDWISWKWNFDSSTNWNYKTINSSQINFTTKSIWNFLQNSSNNYLILHNITNSKVNYNLKSLNSWEYFTNFNTEIIASWEISWFKQNVKIDIKSSEYLNLLKYSIFSN